MKIKLIVLLAIILTLSVHSNVFAQASLFQKVVRTTAKVADNTPLKPMEKAVKAENKKLAKELIEKSRKTVDKTMPYSKQIVLRELKQTLPANVDKSIIKTFENSSEESLATALLLSKGAKGVANNTKSVKECAELLKKLDADTLCIIGRYGDDITDSARLFITSIDEKMIKTVIDPAIVKNADKIVSAKRAVTMGDFNNFFRKTGEAGAEFWRKTVKPHWKLFATSGVMAAILLAPESYIDYAIEGTKEAGYKIVHTIGKVIVAGGEVTAETIKTATESTAETVENNTEEIDKGLWKIITSFFSSVTVKVITVVVVIIGLIWFFSLSLVQSCVRWLFNGIRKIWKWFRRPPKKLGPDVE